ADPKPRAIRLSRGLLLRRRLHFLVRRRDHAQRVPQRVESELSLELPSAAVVVLLQKRRDRVPPDTVELRVRVVGGHEIRRSDRQLVIRDTVVEHIEQLGRFHVELVLLEPKPQDARDRFLPRHERNEVEAPAERRVNQRDRSVGSVHCPDDIQVLGERELILRRVLKRNASVAVLEQEEQLTEDLRQVPAVYLVDDQYIRVRHINTRLVGEAAKGARLQLVVHAPGR